MYIEKMVDAKNASQEDTKSRASLKICHLFSDKKFIENHSNKFKRSGFQNDYYYISEFEQGEVIDGVVCVAYKSENYDALKGRIKTYDCVVVYLLDGKKQELLDATLPSQLILWNFYGYELYSLISDNWFSFRTILQFSSGRIRTLTRVLKFVKNRISNSLGIHRFVKHDFKRIDFFLWYNPDEYDLLKKYIPKLPCFLNLPISTSFEKHSIQKKRREIIIGNSRSPYNNHIDVLAEVDSISGDIGASIYLPFNYGSENDYTNNIRKFVKSMKVKVVVEKNFIPFEQYANYISGCSTAVFNSYRQMAVGNIFILLASGVKIYLSEKNPTYSWLLKMGFVIYNFPNDFRKDLIVGNIELNEEISMTNRKLALSLKNESQLENFFSVISQEISRKKEVLVAHSSD